MGAQRADREVSMPIVGGDRPGYQLLICGHIEGQFGTQVIPALDSARMQAADAAFGRDPPPSDKTLRDLLAGLQRLWTDEPTDD